MVNIAREQTAGGNVQPKLTIVNSLEAAHKYALTTGAPLTIIQKLQKCKEKVNAAKTLKDRLEVDDILCGMLNDEIGDEYGTS